jgi:hypothetical protein
MPEALYEEMAAIDETILVVAKFANVALLDLLRFAQQFKQAFVTRRPIQAKVLVCSPHLRGNLFAHLQTAEPCPDEKVKLVGHYLSP